MNLNSINATLSMSKFVEVGSKNVEEKEPGNILALFVILIILSACSYIIYKGIEDQDSDLSLSESKPDSDEDEHKRELAIPDGSSEEE